MLEAVLTSGLVVWVDVGQLVRGQLAYGVGEVLEALGPGHSMSWQLSLLHWWRVGRQHPQL